MRKVEVVAGSCIALLAMVSIGQLYLDHQPDPRKDRPQIEGQAPEQAQAEAKPVTADEVIETYLPSISEGTDVGKQVALGSLLDELEGPAYAKSALKPSSQESFAKDAIAVIESSGPDAQASPELKARVAGFVTGRTRGAASRDFALKMLDDEQARGAVLERLGSAQGVGGRRFFEKIQELGGKGLIGGEAYPALLRRTGGKKAVEPIVAVMKSTDNAKVISACVVALQDTGDASVLGPAFERLEATGMIDKPQALPWISGALFAKHMETAEGSALARGVKAMKTRPALVRRGIGALERALAKGDADTRRSAAEAIKKAVIAKQLDAQRGEQLLAGRLSVETEPVLKAELTGGLEQLRGLTETPKPVETKQ